MADSRNHCKTRMKLWRLCALWMAGPGEVTLLWLQWATLALRAVWPWAKGQRRWLSAACLSPQVRKRQCSIDWTCNGVRVSLLLFLSQLVKTVMKRSERLSLYGPGRECHKCPIYHWLPHWPRNSTATSHWNTAHQKCMCGETNSVSLIALIEEPTKNNSSHHQMNNFSVLCIVSKSHLIATKSCVCHHFKEHRIVSENGFQRLLCVSVSSCHIIQR